MIQDTLTAISRLIRGRSNAYKQVFDSKNVFTKDVLKDLAKFCRAHESTYHSDPRIHAVMEGRREVFLRIQQHLELTDQELLELHKIKEIMKGEK